MYKPLSYSSFTKLLSCEAKYFHHKVAQTPYDPDYEESEALGLGKAVHGVLEDFKHGDTYPGSLAMVAKVIDRCAEFKQVGSEPLVMAMAYSYMKMHKASGLKVVVCELPLSTDEFLGYIDVILKDENTGGWWIADLKTTGSRSQGVDGKLPGLSADPQLNIYASFADRIAPFYELDPAKFQGCRYRVVTKTKSQPKDKESPYDFALRMYERGSIEVFDVVVPKAAMQIGATVHAFNHAWERAKSIQSGEAPSKNLGYCMSYFKPCEYWSQCHGSKTHTESKDLVTVWTEEDYKTAKEML